MDNLSKNNLSICDVLIENLYNRLLTKDEKELLNLAFSNKLTEQKFSEFFKSWNYKNKTSNKLLVLTYVSKLYPNFKLDENPNLKSLLMQLKCANLRTISHFSKIGKALNKSGIIPIILKGGAMKYLRPDLPRIMGDIDILVKEDEFLKSIELSTPLGYYYEKICTHSVDLHDNKTNENTLDIHKFIYFASKHDKELTQDFYKRAQEKEIFGIKALIPCFEDMLFITLVNLVKNLRESTSKANLIFNLFDCKFLIENKENLNWDIINQNAEKINVQKELNFAIKFIEKYIKNTSFDKINKISDKDIEKYAITLLYDRFYLDEIRIKCRAMKLDEIIKKPDKWANYLLLKPKYQILKLFRKHPKSIKLFIKNLNKDYKNYTNS